MVEGHGESRDSRIQEVRRRKKGFSFFASGRQFAVAARASAFELWI